MIIDISAQGGMVALSRLTESRLLTPTKVVDGRRNKACDPKQHRKRAGSAPENLDHSFSTYHTKKNEVHIKHLLWIHHQVLNSERANVRPLLRVRISLSVPRLSLWSLGHPALKSRARSVRNGGGATRSRRSIGVIVRAVRGSN